jgi:hypothetical protein
MLTIGLLIATATGLCTGNAIVEAFTRPMDLPRSTVVTGALIVGGIPCGIGIALAISAARQLRRRARQTGRANPEGESGE